MKRMYFPVSSIEQKNLIYFDNYKQIIIPEYQRDYSWTEKEINELVSDIELGFKYLRPVQFGNIILITSDRNHYHLIDGQQRLTTIFKIMELISKKMVKYPILKTKIEEIYTEVGYRINDTRGARLVREIGSIEIPDNIIELLNKIVDGWFDKYGTEIEDENGFIDCLRYSSFIVQTFYSTPNEFFRVYELILDYFYKMNTRGLKFDDSEIEKITEYINKKKIEKGEKGET